MGFLEPWIIEDQEDQPHINDSESEEDVPPQPFRIGFYQPFRIVYPLQEVSILKRSKVGRKRAKRQENNIHLITLGSDEFPDIPEDLIQSKGSHFAQLMKDDAAMQQCLVDGYRFGICDVLVVDERAQKRLPLFVDEEQLIESSKKHTVPLQTWTVFMDASEESQNKILDGCIHHNLKQLKIEDDKVISPEDALLNMSFEQRKFFVKSNLPLGLLAYLENEVIQFFLESPNKVFTVDKLSSYERRILHGVALYYKLQSKSYDCKETNSRLLSMYNTNRKFLIPSVLLSEYLADKKKTKSRVCQ